MPDQQPESAPHSEEAEDEVAVPVFPPLTGPRVRGIPPEDHHYTESQPSPAPPENESHD